jgi:hypothetical protein
VQFEVFEKLTSVCFSKLLEKLYYYLLITYIKKLCSHVDAYVTCEIDNFNINNFIRKSTKNASYILSLVNVWVFYYFHFLHCISFFCTVFNFFALYFIFLHCISLFCTVFHFFALYFIFLHCISFFCTVFHFFALYFTFLHCISKIIALLLANHN